VGNQLKETTLGPELESDSARFTENAVLQRQFLFLEFELFQKIRYSTT